MYTINDAKNTMLVMLCGFIAMLSVSGEVVAEGNTPGGDTEVGDTRAALEKWVETCRIISQEKRELRLSREMLNEQIGLVQREIEALKKKTAEAEESIAEADKKRAEMVEENESLKETSSALSETLSVSENRTRSLLKNLPDPIRNRVKPLSQRIPENPDETKLSVAERFQNVIGILNEINKFNREITVTSEIRSLPDGNSVEVTAMYIGIGQGYYVSSDGTIAGVGRRSPEGWVWKQADASADQIAQAIAILKNEQVAAFVQLPVMVK